MADNVVFEYRHINHVKTLAVGETEDDFKAEVIEKYRLIDAGNKPPAASPPRAAPEPKPAPATAIPPFVVTTGKGVGWFDVIDGDGKKQNDTSLRKAAANELADKLNAG